jgi:hypothetical protein
VLQRDTIHLVKKAMTEQGRADVIVDIRLKAVRIPCFQRRLLPFRPEQ